MLFRSDESPWFSDSAYLRGAWCELGWRVAGAAASHRKTYEYLSACTAKTATRPCHCRVHGVYLRYAIRNHRPSLRSSTSHLRRTLRSEPERIDSAASKARLQTISTHDNDRYCHGGHAIRLRRVLRRRRWKRRRLCRRLRNRRAVLVRRNVSAIHRERAAPASQRIPKADANPYIHPAANSQRARTTCRVRPSRLCTSANSRTFQLTASTGRVAIGGMP